MNNPTPKDSASAQDIDTFLNHALPDDGKVHTLALGELHDDAAHLKWLRGQLGRLKEQHQLTTLGLECPAYWNVFFWAYKDGTLEKALKEEWEKNNHKGDAPDYKQAARDYVVEALNAIIKPDSKESNKESILLALDLGINVVAYDCRDSEGKYRDLFKDEGLGDLMNGENAPARLTLADNTVHQARIDRTNDSYSFAWQLGEVAWLRSLNPEYATRLDAIDALIQTGHKKIKDGKLGSDGLSAVMFETLAPAKGNRLTIGGVSHLLGVHRDKGHSIEHIHGTFGEHLFSVRNDGEKARPHTVTQAVIAGVGMLPIIAEIHRNNIADTTRPMVAVPPTHVFGIDGDGPPTPMNPFRPHKDAVPIKKALRGEKREFAAMFTPDPHTAAYINPLLMPEIKQAANDVRTAMGFESLGHGRG